MLMLALDVDEPELDSMEVETGEWLSGIALVPFNRLRSSAGDCPDGNTAGSRPIAGALVVVDGLADDEASGGQTDS